MSRARSFDVRSKNRDENVLPFVVTGLRRCRRVTEPRGGGAAAKETKVFELERVNFILEREFSLVSLSS